MIKSIKRILKKFIPSPIARTDQYYKELKKENKELRTLLLNIQKELREAGKSQRSMYMNLYTDTQKIRTEVHDENVKLAIVKQDLYSTSIKVNELLEYYNQTEKDRLNRIETLLSTNNYGVTRNKRNTRIVVSLTSYKKRIATVPLVLERLLCQTVKPDHIILYLAKDNFPQGEKELPGRLIEMQSQGVEIRWCERDIKSYKKIIPALRDFPDDIIITADDDLYYELDFVEKLYDSYKKYPYVISALRTHKMKFNSEGELLPYSEWDKETSEIVGKPTRRLFPTNGGGVLYPPHSLPKEAMDEDSFMKLCPNADDIWLKFMSIMNNMSVVLVEPFTRLKYVEGTQEESLWSVNATENDVQIKHFLDVYNEFQKDEPSLIERIFNENKWVNSAKYWEERYKIGGNSGAGSYNQLSVFKADVLNTFVKEHNIELVVEWGCGDGNQLKLAEYPKYVGFDVSQTAIDMCEERFADDLTKQFIWSGGNDFHCTVRGELTLSLDVIYHLIEDEVFESYMKRLFATSNQYVCIYSCNFDKQHTRHVKCREFTKYIEKNITGWELIEKIDNKYPYDEKKPNDTSWSDFYFYKKID